MRGYVVYENIIQKNITKPFLSSSRELLDFFGKNISPLKTDIVDRGCDKLAMNAYDFHYNNAKILALSNRENSNIISIEDSSFLSLLLTKAELKQNGALRDKINSKLKEENLHLDLDIDVISLIEYIQKEIGFDLVAKSIKHNFTKFSASLYLGPSECTLRQFYDTKQLEEILKLTKISLIEYSSRERACGYEIMGIKRPLCMKMAGKLLLDMVDSGADFVIVNDARSFIVFDRYQKEIEKSINREIGLTIFNIAQIILISCGIVKKESLGLHEHRVKTEII
jgi:succinate dehydrogenase / fumarate reductase cytochrome b subunit